ncbi:MAG: hypothetical protein SFU98_16765 [Leptospiraceae bacterium]|nr:hypothetical protein [Leptospiraceae bacterium]
MNSKKATIMVALIVIILGVISYFVLGRILPKQSRYRNTILSAILIVIVTLANLTSNGGCLSPVTGNLSEEKGK